jgi:N-acetylneuraminic acid mutarotase
MKNAVFVVLLMAEFVARAAAQPPGTTFTYQGRLSTSGVPANGTYDLRFSLWDAESGGNFLGNAITNASMSVAGGIFVATVDFGNFFDGSSRWVEIGARTNGSVAFVTLSPRQPLTPSPYAIYAGAVNAAGIAGTIAPANIGNGTITSNMLAPGAAAANLAANGQAVVPGGGILLSSDPNATNLTGAGYMRVGGVLDLSWQQRSSDAARVNHTAVWTGSKMIVWGGFGPVGGGSGNLNSGASYEPASNIWSPVSTSKAPSARSGHTAVWTGSKMIVWGGAATSVLGDGNIYDPVNDSWSLVAASNAPAARVGHTAVWTGSEMIIWGGNGADSAVFNDGARYNPTTDTWSVVGTNNAPPPRMYHKAVWTGAEMIVWGGSDNNGVFLSSGGRYSPGNDSWTSVTTNNAPAGRQGHTAIWAGSRMIVWGGETGGWPTPDIFVNDGGNYDPATDAWIPVGATGAPAPRSRHTANWTGKEMIIWGGIATNTWLTSGARYDPISNTWLALTTSGAPAGREDHTAVWTGSEMVVFGGSSATPAFGDTYAYASVRTMYLYLKP